MTREVYTNNPTSTLNGNVSSTSSTSLQVNDATSFPATGNFSIIIDSEIMKVTAVSGTTFTVVRGSEGTTAATHSSGASVDGIVTKRVLDTLRSDQIQVVANASRPATGFAGTTILETDNPYISRDNGSGWDQFGPLQLMVPPVYANFTGANVGSNNTFTQGATGQPLLWLNTASSIGVLYETAPSRPWNIDYTWFFTPNRLADSRAGPAWYDTGSGKVCTVSFLYESAGSGMQMLHIYVTHWTSTTVFSAHAFNGYLWPMQYHWCRIREDSSNRYVDVGDGIQWTNLFSEGRTTFMTADSVGFHHLSNSLGNATLATWLNYRKY